MHLTAMSFTLFSNQLYLPAITTFTFILLLLITSRIVFILIIIIIIIIVIIMIIIITIIIIIINTPFSLLELSLKSYDYESSASMFARFKSTITA